MENSPIHSLAMVFSDCTNSLEVFEFTEFSFRDLYCFYHGNKCNWNGRVWSSDLPSFFITDSYKIDYVCEIREIAKS